MGRHPGFTRSVSRQLGDARRADLDAQMVIAQQARNLKLLDHRDTGGVYANSLQSP